MAQVALSVDARTVLFHLNEMGFRNITAEHLKEFMKDLRKLIKYEHILGAENNFSGAPSSLKNSSTRKTKITSSSSKTSQTIVTPFTENRTRRLSPNRYSYNQPVVDSRKTSRTGSLSSWSEKMNSTSTKAQGDVRKESTTASTTSISSGLDDGSKVLTTKSSKTSNSTTKSRGGPNVVSTSGKLKTVATSTRTNEVGNLYRTNSECALLGNKRLSAQASSLSVGSKPIYSMTTLKKPTSATSNTSSSTRISANRKPDKPTKHQISTDPVLLYHYYQNEWKKFKINLPGENTHADIRCKVRHKFHGKKSTVVKPKETNSS